MMENYRADSRLFLAGNGNIQVTVQRVSGNSGPSPEALLEKLYEAEDKIDDNLGNKCQLIIKNLKTRKKALLKMGTLLYCLEMAGEYVEKLGDHDWFLVKYGEDEWKSYSFRDFEAGISDTWNVVRDIPDPFDESVLPTDYKRFNSNTVDDSNYKLLWKKLKEIEKKYRKGINYENRYAITDWEAELCYEQGKFIENVEWVGVVVPEYHKDESVITYYTYSRLDYKELRYYLYWRTCFRSGKIITNSSTALYKLYSYELIADFGPYSPEERLIQLENLYKNFKRRLLNSYWIGEYALNHGLEIRDREVETWAYKKNGIDIRRKTDKDGAVQWYEEVISGNYKHAIELMCEKSTWKYKNSLFLQKTKCIDAIAEVIIHALPEIDRIFTASGIAFSDFLIGKVKKTKYIDLPYEHSAWTERVIKRFCNGVLEKEKLEFVKPGSEVYVTDENGNVKRKTRMDIDYYDPYLSEYILKYTEMLFREEAGYRFIDMPQKLTGALMRGRGSGLKYYLSCDTQLQNEEKIYVGLFDEISEIIERYARDYFVSHKIEMDEIKIKATANEESENAYTKTNIMNTDEDALRAIINSSDDTDQVNKLLTVYNDNIKDYLKRTNARRLSSWIWDYWIIHENTVTYEDLSRIVINNKWNCQAKKAIQDRNYDAAVEYIINLIRSRCSYDISKGLISKKVDRLLIMECIILTLTAIDKLFSAYKVDSSDVLLGEWGEYPWNIYIDGNGIVNTCERDCVKNIADLEIYSFDAATKTAIVKRHSYSIEAELFITYVIKRIDNEIRRFINYEKLLPMTIDVNTLFDMNGYSEAVKSLDEVIAESVKVVMRYNKPKDIHVEELKIDISNEHDRRYEFKPIGGGVNDVEAFCKGIANEYYGIESPE